MGKTSLKVGVLGAAGRMGQTACSAVMSDESVELSAAVDLNADSAEVSFDGVPLSGELGDFFKAKVDVVVDFTVAEASRTNLPLLAEEGIDTVVGTSGLSEQDFEWIDQKFDKSSCLVVPNFAIGAVLMMHFAATASPWVKTA